MLLWRRVRLVLRCVVTVEKVEVGIKVKAKVKAKVKVEATVRPWEYVMI